MGNSSLVASYKNAVSVDLSGKAVDVKEIVRLVGTVFFFSFFTFFNFYGTYTTALSIESGYMVPFGYLLQKLIATLWFRVKMHMFYSPTYTLYIGQKWVLWGLGISPGTRFWTPNLNTLALIF